MSHFCPIWRSKMRSKSLHCDTNSFLDFPTLRSNEKVKIPTGALTMEQRLWWMVQSIVPNFICPASWMEAFLSSGRSARHGGHHCRDATLNGNSREAADIEKIRTGRHVLSQEVWRWDAAALFNRKVTLTTRRAFRAGGLDTFCAPIGFLPLFLQAAAHLRIEWFHFPWCFDLLLTKKRKHDRLKVWAHLPMQCFLLFLPLLALSIRIEDITYMSEIWDYVAKKNHSVPKYVLYEGGFTWRLLFRLI